MVERLNKDNLGMAGGTDADLDKFIESDFKIRSGLCPNGCGFLETHSGIQRCASCGFHTNRQSEAKPND